MQNFTSTEKHFLHTHPKTHCRHMGDSFLCVKALCMDMPLIATISLV